MKQIERKARGKRSSRWVEKKVMHGCMCTVEMNRDHFLFNPTLWSQFFSSIS
uniref:Uncharacterized protein n=1 Tax=Anguilla anguilla TaxID=7936 RepID=A0A0E9VCK5_ANGAN